MAKQVGLVFLGSGGGGGSTVEGKMPIAGFVIKVKGLRDFEDFNVIVDPGLHGHLQYKKYFNNDFGKVKALVATHHHADHAHSAAPIIEAITHFSGNLTLITTDWALKGDILGDRAIPRRSQRMANEVVIAKTGSIVRINGPDSTATLVATPTRHGEFPCFGFVMDIGGKKIGYTSDTELFDDLPSHFKGCDALVMNVMKPDNSMGLSGHLFTDTAAKLMSAARPLVGFITHFGGKMQQVGPEKEAKKIEEASGIRTICPIEGKAYWIK